MNEVLDLAIHFITEKASSFLELLCSSRNKVATYHMRLLNSCSLARVDSYVL